MIRVTSLEDFSRVAPPMTRDAVQEALDARLRLEDEGAGELLLVRHAEPARSAVADPLLSCAGLAQAEDLADRLGAQWIEAVYTAPERRAQQTARLVADIAGRPLHVIDCLAEIEFKPEPVAHLPLERYVERFDNTQRWDALPGFEASRQFRRRAVQSIERILAINPSRRVMVVTHASVINAYVSMLLSIPSDCFFTPEHASITTVRWQDGRYALRALNDVSHLDQGRLSGRMHWPNGGVERKEPLTARSSPLTSR